MAKEEETGTPQKVTRGKRNEKGLIKVDLVPFFPFFRFCDEQEKLFLLSVSFFLPFLFYTILAERGTKICAG